MFDVLRKKLVAVSGMRVCSFEDLQNLDVESIDSICLSDTLSSLTASSDHPLRNISVNDSANYSDSISNLDEYSRRKVNKLIKSIKKLETINNKGGKMEMLVFFDLIRDQQYNHVSMGLINEFIKTYRMVPKQYYLHYYMFFLYYAMYYHHTRGVVDVVDEKMKRQHLFHFKSIRAQLKYLQYIIKHSRTH
jgi:hypothetical protein